MIDVEGLTSGHCVKHTAETVDINSGLSLFTLLVCNKERTHFGSKVSTQIGEFDLAVLPTEDARGLDTAVDLVGAV